MPPGDADAGLPFAHTARGLRLKVKLTPKAAREQITDIERNAAGEAWLGAKVRAAPAGQNLASAGLFDRDWLRRHGPAQGP
jgi:hypothetical protein